MFVPVKCLMVRLIYDHSESFAWVFESHVVDFGLMAYTKTACSSDLWGVFTLFSFCLHLQVGWESFGGRCVRSLHGMCSSPCTEGALGAALRGNHCFGLCFLSSALQHGGNLNSDFYLVCQVCFVWKPCSVLSGASSCFPQFLPFLNYQGLSQGTFSTWSNISSYFR